MRGAFQTDLFASPARPRSRRRAQVEHAEQAAFVARCRLAQPRIPQLALLCSIPNGAHLYRKGSSSYSPAALKLLREGLSPGAPDLLLLHPSGPWGYLALEFKSPQGRLSPAQAAWRERIRAAGGRYEMVRSADEAWRVVENYLRGNL